MKTSALCAFLLLLAAFFLNSTVTAQSVTVKFLNGQSGKPIKKGERVWVCFDCKTVRRILDFHTDKQGTVQFDADGAKTFQVNLVGYPACGEQPTGAPAPNYLIDEILKNGLVTRNDCGHLDSEPLRGRLLYFVRPMTWREWLKD